MTDLKVSKRFRALRQPTIKKRRHSLTCRWFGRVVEVPMSMLITGRTLFAFVDLKDPLMATEVAGEEQPGPILSLMSAQEFNFLFLFHTPHTYANAVATRDAVKHRHGSCHVMLHELPVADPKNYSTLMGRLARQVRDIMRSSRDTENSVCVSSGTAEMRAAWFLLTAVGALPATLLQVGSPTDPLFGAANVKVVRLEGADWKSIRDLVRPQEYFGAPDAVRSSVEPPADGESEIEPGRVFRSSALGSAPRFALPMQPVPSQRLATPAGLDAVLGELGIVAGSATLRDAAARAAIAAECDVPVLLLGETGTGKELFAKLIHRISDRRDRPIVPVNCAAIPKELVESFLFGHAKGAFTDANTNQKGKFEIADGTTLFLDELAELTSESQAKLLRVLQDGLVEPLGANTARKVDVRIVAATNRNLQEEVAAGRFREDLYYRLNVVQIRLPSLRERNQEIPSLAAMLLKQVNQRRRRERQFSKEALRRLEQHTWPGNVRELLNVLERSALFSPHDVLGPDDLLIETQPVMDRFTGLPEPGPGFDLTGFLDQARNHLFVRALEKSNGNQSRAAELLGVSKQAVSKFVQGQSDILD